MLNENELAWLVQQLVGTAELLGQPMTPTAAAMLAEDLSGYPRDVLARAMSRVRTEHTGRLVPKAILDRIDEAMGRPAANEAWAMASAALDERATIVWTGEMADAWAVARPLASAGDMVGARMAFIGAYERLVRTSRDARLLPTVSVSLGWDGQMRDAALEQAVQLGYLTHAQAGEHRQPALPAPVFNPVALLAGRVEPAAHAGPDVRKRLAELRDEIASKAGRATRRTLARQRLERMQLSRRKAAVDAQVRERMGMEGKQAWQ